MSGEREKMGPIFRLHLNGGPEDDRYVDHWTSTFHVQQLRGGLNMMLEEEAGAAVMTRTGHYRLRLDSNGEPVPHNLEGFVECDWEGWDG